MSTTKTLKTFGLVLIVLFLITTVLAVVLAIRQSQKKLRQREKIEAIPIEDARRELLEMRSRR